jgi:threonylcarbamoyladenosine tRNA methylthiotransferase MtaB
MILKRMKRRHSRGQAIDFCARVRAARPDVVFGADLIAGFPTETDAMFENTLRMIDEAGLTWLHVFPYSVRPGTPAAKIPGLPGDIVRGRARALRTAGEASRNAFLESCVGGIEDALVEQPGLGRTARYAHVTLPDDAATGSVLRVRITNAADGRLAGIPT